MVVGDSMLVVDNVSLSFGGKSLFKDVNLKFNENSCYGLIGANGSGKSTFLKIIAGLEETTKGNIYVTNKERISYLKQNRNDYEEYSLIETVIMGNDRLYKIMKEKEILYSKEDFNEEDGIKAGELEDLFTDLNGWEAEIDAAILLSGLGIDNNIHYNLMKNTTEDIKVKVLLAKALFGNPEIILLDEPTNYLDEEAIIWLEEFLINYNNTIIVVSHDRHFLNKVCTYILDIDYEKITLFVGNYDFWYESSLLLLNQIKDSNKKKEDKIKELQDFIARFSANASKSKQATSRKKLLDKIVLEELVPSTRKYPYINFEIEKTLGKDVLTIKNVSKNIDGIDYLKNINLTISNTDKIAFIGKEETAKTILFKIITGEMKPDSGEIIFGSSMKYSYFPKEHSSYFTSETNIIDWLSNFSLDKEITYIRGFLGRMLFSNDEALKKVNILSGGECVRLMLSKIMLEKSNVLILDEVTNHLDLETITSLNKGLINYKGVILFSTYDQELISTTANRIIEFLPNGKYIDKLGTYEEYIEFKNNRG